MLTLSTRYGAMRRFRRRIASKPVRCGRDPQAYSRLQYVFVGGSPFAGLPANVTSSNYISAPGRPIPPANQTVSLTCA